MMQQTSVHDDTGFWWDRPEGFWWDRPDGAMLATLLSGTISPPRQYGHLRANRMADMYANGQTLEEIGTEFGVTRERVRQIIKKHHGMTAVDGGYHIRAVRNAEQCAAKANAKCLAKWGCTLVQLRQIPSKVRYSYRYKRRNVINVYGRNAWVMTLWDYYSAWEASGLMDKIGTNRGKYGMTRIDDLLPFTIDNVEIITQSESSLRVIAKIRARTVSVCAAKT